MIAGEHRISRGKSGLHRAGWRLMTAEGDLRASATEMKTADFFR